MCSNICGKARNSRVAAGFFNRPSELGSTPPPHPQCTRVTHHVLDDRDPSKKKSPQVSPPGPSLMRESPFGLRMRKAERALPNTLMRFASTACR